MLDESDEAIRDLSRAREDAVRARRKSRQCLQAMLLRTGHRYSGKTQWTAAHERYLSQQSFAWPAQGLAWEEYRQAVSEAHRRVERLTESLHDQVEQWRWGGQGIDDLARHRPGVGRYAGGGVRGSAQVCPCA